MVDAILDTFGESNDDVEHNFGVWRTVGGPDAMEVEQRVCIDCGRHEFRKP